MRLSFSEIGFSVAQVNSTAKIRQRARIVLAYLGFSVSALPVSALSPIPPGPGRTVTDATYTGVYRLFDDRKGVSSGARFERIRAIVQRGGFRFQGAANGIVLRDLDLSLAEVQSGVNLPAGIELGGTVHDVLVERVVARGFLMVPREGHYTNGDGFSTEPGNYRITFRNVEAFNNSDGGFDLKSNDTRIEDGISIRNGRNYRFWGTGEATTITSRDPRDAHIWLGEGATWRVRKLVVRSVTNAPVIRVAGNATLVIDEHDIQVPAGTPLVVIEQGTVRISWQSGEPRL